MVKILPWPLLLKFQDYRPVALQTCIKHADFFFESARVDLKSTGSVHSMARIVYQKQDFSIYSTSSPEQRKTGITHIETQLRITDSL